jgi:peptidoglycan hydrolase-like protein with peptidoglycan-binding domain
MREATRRPAAEGGEPQAAPSAGSETAGGESGAAAGETGVTGGVAQQAARQQRAHQRRAAASEAEADAFNQRHAAEAAEFNQLTKDACAGEDGKLDPAAVKQWQRAHDVAPDGKIGPKTLAAAGGRSNGEDKSADDAKIDAPKKGALEKQKQASVDDILSWLDLATVEQALGRLKALGTGLTGGEPPRRDAQTKSGPVGSDMTGLNSKVSVGAFAAAVDALKANWSDLDGSARSDKMLAIVNVELAAAGVFPVDGRLDSSVSGQVAGKFHSVDWRLRLNKGLFSRSKLAAADAPHMAATVYHEARHAEQTFRMAQTLAGRNDKMSPTAIAKMIDIPPEVADAAIRAKILPSDPAAAFGERMFEARHGAGGAHTAETLKQVEKEMTIYRPLRERYEAALQSKDSTAIEAAHAALQQIKQPVMRAWDAYINLATEADAFQAEHAVDEALGVKPQ